MFSLFPPSLAVLFIASQIFPIDTSTLVHAAVLPKRQDDLTPSTTTVYYVPSTTTLYVPPSSPSSSEFAAGGGGVAAPSASSTQSGSSWNNGDTPMPVLAPGQNPSNPASWTVYNADQVCVHFLTTLSSLNPKLRLTRHLSRDLRCLSFLDLVPTYSVLFDATPCRACTQSLSIHGELNLPVRSSIRS